MAEGESVEDSQRQQCVEGRSNKQESDLTSISGIMGESDRLSGFEKTPHCVGGMRLVTIQKAFAGQKTSRHLKLG